MREFLNAPNGPSKQSPTPNERAESDPLRSPLVGRTVWSPFNFQMLPSHCKLFYEINEFAICRMYLTYLFIWPEIKLKKVFEIRCLP